MCFFFSSSLIQLLHLSNETQTLPLTSEGDDEGHVRLGMGYHHACQLLIQPLVF